MEATNDLLTQTKKGCIFIISSVLNICTSGPSPFQLYQGTLRCTATNSTNALKLFEIDTSSSQRSEDEENPALQEMNGCSLYIGFELLSPRLLSPISALAPYRFSLRDPSDELMIAGKGMANDVHVDHFQRIILWGNALSIHFPTDADLNQFTSSLKYVSFHEADLRKHISSALVTALPI